jgi:PrtD family type I secretion system ABC transporter
VKRPPGIRSPERSKRSPGTTRRLEELLRDPGPNIKVTRLVPPGQRGDAAAATNAAAGEWTVESVAEPRERAAAAPQPASEAAASKPADTASPEPATIASGAAAEAALDAEWQKAEQSAAKAEASAASTQAEVAETAAPKDTPAEKPSAEKRPARPAPQKAKAAPGKPAARPSAAPAPPPPRAAQPAHGAAAAGPSRGGFVAWIINWLLPGNGELKRAIAASGPAFAATGLFSFVINILMLVGPLFMLQVYDRVMTSGSLPTLTALFAITAALYVVVGVLELVRSRIIVRIGVEVDQRLGTRIFRASLKRSLTNPGASMPALRDLDNLRAFVASPGPLTFFDAPWTPVYLLVIFLVHWVLGVSAVIGAAVLLFVAWLSETCSREPLTEAGKSGAKSLELADTGLRNAEALTAMGMLGTYLGRWERANDETIAWQTLAADRLGGMSALSKALRLFLQSAMLAIGAALAVKGDISAGSIIAGTIIFGRALAPVEQAISHWRGFLKAQESYFKLDELLTREPPPPQKTVLPSPKGLLEVSSLRVAAPDTRQLILANLNFRVAPGEMLAVIGPSASGKSTLARTIVGLWPAFSGVIQLDGARLDHWDQEALGRYIGYLPQAVELFSGTVKENISRFTPGAKDEDVIAAAEMAHAHEMILALPKGYDTELGNFGTYLSAGQRQRIGLARALYGNPALVVLDEPNSNLDRTGDEALAGAIDGMRARGQAVVLVSHRVQAIGKADLLLYVDRGVQRAFGPRAEVMKLFQGSPQAQAQMQSGAVERRAGGSNAA